MHPLRTCPLLLALLAASCVAPPPAQTRAHYGLVRAGSPTEAQSIAGLLDELHPEVCAMLPGTRERDVEVWMQDELRLFFWSRPAHGVDALSYTARGRIHLDREARFLRETLAHELVHLLLGPDWSTLPPVIEEGLAEYVAMDVSDGNGELIRGGRLVQALAGIGGDTWVVRFEKPAPSGVQSFHCGQREDHLVDPAEVYRGRVADISPHSPSRAKEGLYGLGFVAVARLIERGGYAHVHRLCEKAARAGRSTIDAGILAEECGLSGDREDWKQGILAGLDAADQRAIARFLAPYLGRTAAAACRALFEDKTAVEFLDEVRPVFGLVGTDVETELFRIREFRDALIEAW